MPCVSAYPRAPKTPEVHRRVLYPMDFYNFCNLTDYNWTQTNLMEHHERGAPGNSVVLVLGPSKEVPNSLGEDTPVLTLAN